MGQPGRIGRDRVLRFQRFARTARSPGTRSGRRPSACPTLAAEADPPGARPKCENPRSPTAPTHARRLRRAPHRRRHRRTNRPRASRTGPAGITTGATGPARQDRP
ncbi:hypothetical protein [Lysobacter gummosus]|uniref:hypothetical protein n=1 Tax=Lysobacter gummosus TaxID=262324 RepID=UPI00362D23D5